MAARPTREPRPHHHPMSGPARFPWNGPAPRQKRGPGSPGPRLGGSLSGSNRGFRLGLEDRPPLEGPRAQDDEQRGEGEQAAEEQGQRHVRDLRGHGQAQRLADEHQRVEQEQVAQGAEASRPDQGK